MEKEKALATLNKLLADSPETLETFTLVSKFSIKDSSLCKMLAKDGLDKTKTFLVKIDAHVNEVKKLRDQYITALVEAAQPDTKYNIGLLAW